MGKVRRTLNADQRRARLQRMRAELARLRDHDGPLVERAFLSREIEREHAELLKDAV